MRITNLPIPRPTTPREHRSLNWIGLAWHGDSSQNYIYNIHIHIRIHSGHVYNSNIGKSRRRLRRHRIRRPSTGEYHRCSSLFMGQVTPWRYSWTGNELGNVHRRLPNARTLSSRDPLLRHPPPPASTLSLSLRLCACIRSPRTISTTSIQVDPSSSSSSCDRVDRVDGRGNERGVSSRREGIGEPLLASRGCVAYRRCV